MEKQKVSLTKIFTFDTAHALENYPGKCRHIHGHTYILHVTISGDIRNERGDPYDGIIIDFSELKKWVHDAVIQQFDHALLLREGSALAAMTFPEWERIYLTSYQPSCENILLDILQKLQTTIPNNILVKKLTLYETPTSYAEWER
ncbi:MAG: 6-carboxytetrahydropterin synthase [Bacteroidetes bacterium]|nr:6-carboxytetrahydropterin synthase [Bacteroidota bacterium]